MYPGFLLYDAFPDAKLFDILKVTIRLSFLFLRWEETDRDALRRQVNRNKKLVDTPQKSFSLPIYAKKHANAMAKQKERIAHEEMDGKKRSIFVDDEAELTNRSESSQETSSSSK